MAKIRFFIGKEEISEKEWNKRARSRIQLDNKLKINTAQRKSAMDAEIADKGAIIDNMGNPHTTAQSYKNYLKDNGLVIKDWTPGTLSKNR